MKTGEKYYQVMERIKGEYPSGMKTYCPECIWKAYINPVGRGV